MRRIKQQTTVSEHGPESLSIILKIKSREQQVEEMHKQYADVVSVPAPTPRTISETHDYYERFLTNSGGTPITPAVPQDYHPRLTPAQVESETNSIRTSLGEAVAQRAEAMASAIVNVPIEDPAVAASFGPIIETAEKHAISKVDSAQNKRSLWIWGAAVAGIAVGAVFILGRRSKGENKNS